MIQDSKFFSIRRGELLPLIMAAVGAFLSISSVVFGRTLSDAILLSARPAINIGHYFILSSLVLMAVSMVYFRLLRAISATRLNAATLIIFAATTFVFEYFTPETPHAILGYAIFLITAPSLGNIIVWNSIGDAFNARQGRRLFHFVAAASTVGGITAGSLIPPFISNFGIISLSISDAVVFLAMGIPVVILNAYRRTEKTQFSMTSESHQSMWHDFRQAYQDISRSALLKHLSIIFFLTALGTNIIDFALKDYLQTNFDQDGIAMFYGHFNTFSNGFNLLVQLTLLSQFLTRFRTRTLFAVTPVVLLLFSLPFLFVYSAIFVIALRFIDVALRFTILDAAREIAISPMPRLLRNRAKVIFKGVMNPLGGIIAGVILNLLVPMIGARYTPLLLIPIALIGLFYVRDLNRYCAFQLFEQLKGEDSADQVLDLPAYEMAAAQLDSAHFDPQQLVDDSAIIRSSALDAILLTQLPEARHKEVINEYTQGLVAREVQLAYASLVWMDLLAKKIDKNEKSTQKIRIDSSLQTVYDDAIHRLFKGLMVLYRRDVIRTIYQSLSASRASTRAQAIELLQLTLSNAPYAKRIILLCEDFSRSEKLAILADIEAMTLEQAFDTLDKEDDRGIHRIVHYLEQNDLIDHPEKA